MAGANRLTQLQVTRLKEPGQYNDGAGLLLNIGVAPVFRSP